uniref:Uncharacterized protein n=1 Tax=Romanomermis culicivorax TaxID=13658 RepID=A0A915JVN2_ROMCU
MLSTEENVESRVAHVADWANLSKIEQCAHDQCEILRALTGRQYGCIGPENIMAGYGSGPRPLANQVVLKLYMERNKYAFCGKNSLEYEPTPSMLGAVLGEHARGKFARRIENPDTGHNQLCAPMDALSVETFGEVVISTRFKMWHVSACNKNLIPIPDPANIPTEYPLTLTGRETHARDPQDPNANQRPLLLNQNGLLIFASDIDLQELSPVTVCYRTKVVKHTRFSLMQYGTKL